MKHLELSDIFASVDETMDRTALVRALEARNAIPVTEKRAHQPEFFATLDAWDDYLAFERKIDKSTPAIDVPFLRCWECRTR